MDWHKSWSPFSTRQTWTGILRQFKDSDVLEYEVQLLGIDTSDDKGKEVVTTFYVKDLDNAEEFYTDSNAMQMQYRKLNYREDWSPIESHQPISSNYYPVNSAIAIRDKDTHLQMTVMNDRSQGGSAIDSGRIELMQNRKLLHDDWRGVDENLDERDANGEGMAVTATYHIQLFNYKTTKSAQRAVQKIVDEPLQYFFAMDQEFPAELIDTDCFTETVRELQSSATENGALKIHMIPLAKNSILLRLENIADIFDGSIESQTDYFDIPSFAQSIWDHANHGEVELNDVRITERTLGDNEDRKDWLDQKHQWKTESKYDRPAPDQVLDKAHFNVALNPQRIRLFRLDFVPITNAT